MADVGGRCSSARRLSWGVADQAVSSLSNFVVGAYVAKTLGATSLGAFALAFFTYSIILNGSRGVATDPLMVRYSGAPPPTWRPAVSAATGVALVVGVVTGLVSLAVGLTMSAVSTSEVGDAFVALAIGLPGLVLQDSWRYAFFSSGRGAQAFVNDSVWAVLLVGGLLAHGTQGMTVERVMLFFGGTATIAAAVGLVQAGLVPAPRQALAWLREHQSLGPRYLTENVIMGLSGQFRSFVLAGVSGLAAVGQLRAAEMLIGPFLVIFMGISQVAVPEGRRWLARGMPAFTRFCLLLSVGLSAAAVGYGLGVLLLLPLGVGDLILGSVWESAYLLAPGVIVSSMAGSFMVGASAGLRAMGQASRSLRAQTTVTVITVIGGGVGAAGWGAVGAVWGGAAASIAGAAVWWTHLLRGARDHARSAASDPRPRTERAVADTDWRPPVVVASLMRETGGTGVQTHVAAVCRYLESVGASVSLVTPFSSPALLVKPIFAVRYAIAPLSSSASVWWYRHWHGVFLKRALRASLARAPDAVVYAQCPVSAAAALAVRHDQRVVMAVHFNLSQADEWAEKNEIAPDGRMFASIRDFEERVVPRVDCVVHVSEFMRTQLERRMPALVGVPSVVVPNFVDRSPETPATPVADLITVGCLEPRKNQRYLLEVLRAAAVRGHRYSLSVVGDGPDRAELQSLVRDWGMEDQVRFLGYRRDARDLMRAHRLYCHASRMEAFGIVLVEAMSEGVPVLAGAVGGAAAIVRPGVDGEFWSLDDVEAAAGVLISMMSDPERLRALGASGRTRVEQEYSSEVVGARLARVLHRTSDVLPVGA